MSVQCLLYKAMLYFRNYYIWNIAENYTLSDIKDKLRIFKSDLKKTYFYLFLLINFLTAILLYCNKLALFDKLSYEPRSRCIFV